MPRLRAAAILVMLVAAAALPADARTDDRAKPIVYVHGFDATFSPGYNCGTYWGPMPGTLESWGHTGERVTVAYYYYDYNCTYTGDHHGSHSTHHSSGHFGGSHTRNTSIRHLGYHLAWMIYDHFTVHGQAVDIVGHSMGGLITRYALAGVATGSPDFPGELLVEDVVTLGTPHDGTGWAYGCGYTQCFEMRRGSSLIKWLAANAQNPLGSIGVDWTVIGSEDDGIVPAASAVAMGVPHKVSYVWYEGIDHIDFMFDTQARRDRDVWYQENNDGVWRWDPNHARTVLRTDDAFVTATQ